MKVLKLDGGSYRIFKDDLTVMDRLEPKTYQIQFNKLAGFYLEERSPLTVKEKLYGEHQKKTEKIMKSFQVATRSLGVIFSGKKGIGKSIAGRLLCEKMVGAGYPVIIVDKYVQGLPNFIDSIEQECLLFSTNSIKPSAKKRTETLIRRVKCFPCLMEPAQTEESYI